ncbi:MAG: hypothetical protein EOM67_14270, partial [Spirochaetia bacterium]|nr:hypothetical protein [Spirochaetia bacterium]
IQMGEDYRVDYTTSKTRPGYWENRQNTIPGTLKLFKKESGDSWFDFQKASTLFTHGVKRNDLKWSKDAVDWDLAQEVADEIVEIATHSDSSKELMEQVYDMYKRRFHKEVKSEDVPSSGELEEVDVQESGETDGEADGEMDSECGSGEASDDSETDDNKDSNDENPEAKSEGDGEKTGGKVVGCTDKDDVNSEFEKEMERMEKEFLGKAPLEEMFGKRAKELVEEKLEKLEKEKDNIRELLDLQEDEYTNRLKRYNSKWSENEIATYTKELCKGIHSGTRILYGKRKNSYYSDGERKVDKVKDVLTHDKAEANLLGNKLIQMLKAAQNNRGEISTSGSKIIASKAWKPGYTGETEVFYKKTFKEEGEYVIDLVLDASGSQHYRNYDIGSQAFIIAQACYIAKIPCRVTQFRTVGSITLLELLRDYDDPEKENLNCYEFYGDRENRDGLAIQMANVELQKRPEKNKIMLVLSDGLPCDVCGGKIIDKSGGLGRYLGETANDKAIKDIHDTVNRIRKSGVALMGVYVGDSDSITLKFEKMMYEATEDKLED